MENYIYTTKYYFCSYLIQNKILEHTIPQSSDWLGVCELQDAPELPYCYLTQGRLWNVRAPNWYDFSVPCD